MGAGTVTKPVWRAIFATWRMSPGGGNDFQSWIEASYSMRKYRVFFVIVALIAVVSLFVFQMMDDGALEPGGDGQPQQAIDGAE